MASANDYASSFADIMHKLTSGGDLSSCGLESAPAHEPTAGPSDLVAVAGNTPQQPPLSREPVVPEGSIVRPMAARDFLEDISLLDGPNLDFIKKLGVDPLKLLHVANGWPWETPLTCHKAPSALVLAKQLVELAAVETPPDASISDAARAIAALALQARHYEGGPLQFSLGHIPEFVKTAIASAPRPVGGVKRTGPVTKTPPPKKPKAKAPSPNVNTRGSGGSTSAPSS